MDNLESLKVKIRHVNGMHGTKGHKKLVLNDVDVTNRISGFTLNSAADEVTTITVTFVVDEIE